jgi:hypothetical protein
VSTREEGTQHLPHGSQRVHQTLAELGLRRGVQLDHAQHLLTRQGGKRDGRVKATEGGLTWWEASVGGYPIDLSA